MRVLLPDELAWIPWWDTPEHRKWQELAGIQEINYSKPCRSLKYYLPPKEAVNWYNENTPSDAPVDLN